MSDKGLLLGQVAVVTGGGGGIGAGICHRLANAGASVVVTYNSQPQKADALLAELTGETHLSVQTQVTDAESIASLVSTVRSQYGRLDILVNNAGMTRYVPHEDLDDLDDALIDQIFQVNWRGAFACVRGFRELLAAGDGGLVVNISSTASLLAMGSNIAYCASKAAINSMTVSLARALAPEIRVVAVAPGLVDGEYAQSLDAAWRQAQIDATPLQRLASPDDVGAAILAVATLLPRSTGCVIPVEGGRLIM